MANEKIMIVEDDVVLLELLKARLETSGYSILIADNAKDGILKIMSERPDLMLVDIMMRGMDGIEMIKVVHSMTDLKHIPVIVVSALGRDSDIKKAMEAGAEDYIVKPYSFEDLVKRIQKLLK